MPRSTFTSHALNRLSAALTTIIGVLLAALTIVVTFQVLGRYVPFIPRPLWTEEISRWLLAWMVFLGAAIALRRSDHFVIDMIPQRLDETFGRYLQTFVLLAIFAISVILLVGGSLMAYGGMSRISTASGLPLALAFAAVPVGGLFMTLFSMELTMKVLRSKETPLSQGATGSLDASASQSMRERGDS